MSSENEQTNPYAEPILATIERYRELLNERKKWTNKDRYAFTFLANLENKLDMTNPAQLNREIGYICGVMIDLGYTTVQHEWKTFHEVFWPVDESVYPGY